MLALQRLYFDRPAPADLVALDDALAHEIQARLTALGAAPGGALRALYRPMSGEPDPGGTRLAIGTARATPTGWDAAWQAALEDWMGVENLEERTAALGWIDPRVLEFLRSRPEVSQG